MDLYLVDSRHLLKTGRKITLIISLAIGIIIGPNYLFKYFFSRISLSYVLIVFYGFDFLPEKSIEDG